MRRFAIVGVLACALLFVVGIAGASTPGADARLSNDQSGYASNYTLAGQGAYTDQTLAECSISRGRQNEPSVALNPRNPSVLLGSSNDYCGVYNRGAENGAIGPIWLGYYRSENGGSSWASSLVPGYPDDTSYPGVTQRPRTASAGDPVIAWDKHGRAFFGSESSDDPAGSKKTWGDVWVARFENPQGESGPSTRDGLKWTGTTTVAQGSSAPNLLGKFNDKTAIEVDRTNSNCEGNVYFSWSRFTGNGGVGIYFSRSTDHGTSFSSPTKLTSSIQDVQFPDIAVTGNGHVYVTFRQFDNGGKDANAVMIAKSTDCGRTFAPAVLVTPFIENDAQDQRAAEPIPQPQAKPDDPVSRDEPGSEAAGSTARDCGDFSDACASGFTFFRRDTQVRSTADQLAASEYVYIVYDATKPETETSATSTYHTAEPGVVGQAATFFVRYNGANGSHTAPSVIDNQARGNQVFPDISADGGVLHAIWWDSRNDTCYDVTRPIGNCANRTTVPSLDVFAAKSTDRGATWTGKSRVTDVTTNPNYEQFDNRAVPFAGDYLWVTSSGDTAYAVWTDWRNTVQGTDQRETPEDEDAGTADVLQCRDTLTLTDKKGNTFKAWSGDNCPHAGGIDQNIYGDRSP